MNKQKICDKIYKNIDLICSELGVDNTFYIFGYNQYTEGIMNKLYQRGIYVKGILDNASALWGKRIGECIIISPEKLMVRCQEKIVVFIASQYYEAMKNQLRQLIPTAEIKIYLLYDFKKENSLFEKEKKYWENDEFDRQIHRIELGKGIYEQWKQPRTWLVLSPTPSIGDNFLWNLSFGEFKRKYEFDNYRILVASKGSKKVIELFGERNVEILTEESMELLCKYILFVGEDKAESLLVYPRFFSLRCLDFLASWKGMTWQQIYTEYLFQLESNIELNFPDIWMNGMPVENSELSRKRNKKAVILSPYANTVDELPLVFWEKLAGKLVQKGFAVLTNTVGDQMPVKGSVGIEIPLSQVGLYLEYVGYFISLRNGLCDIVGRAECAQIIIFRDRKQLHCTEMEFNDLHVNGISRCALYVIYEEENYEKSVEEILSYIE